MPLKVVVIGGGASGLVVKAGGITYVGGTVDADRSRCRLADSHNIRSVEWQALRKRKLLKK